ncbi:hypothetical protein [Pinibacter aurantiacus]|uniref:Uncharacterized protein n=1 Tax=Pinibacter aurantiacus TaxID=2851599 RepID=A0A9E2SBD2_9BACT|nr:hypothetical protein [Pinibacter aurantiacus]MBV4357350.1 hypothetical protein [Pinibacter aurantiacus]
MDYATRNNIRHNQDAQTIKATKVAQAVGRVHALDGASQGRKRNKERQKKISSHINAADGFVKCTFLPKLKTTEKLPVGKKAEKQEHDFYRSLSLLAEHYDIQPMQSKQFGFPYNIALAIQDAETQLQNKLRHWEELGVMRDGKKTFLTTEERYNTGSSLYYIPIVPLFRISKNKNRKQAAQLLQSVCSYLYHIVDVPYYRQENSYLHWMYEMVTEWIVSDDENEETPTDLSEIKQSEWVGDIMEHKIFNHQNLLRFEQRLNHFKSRDSFDEDCFLLAGKTFALYQQYPNTTINRNAYLNNETEEEDDYYQNIVTMDKYISFCADTKGYLFQTVFDSINTELQEYSQIEEPAIRKHFDGCAIPDNNLDFETRLFTLIEDLIDLLNNF